LKAANTAEIVLEKAKDRGLLFDLV